MTDTNESAALALADYGFSVFPLTPGADCPLIEDWRGLASIDPDQIQQWWRHAPDANIGIATEHLLVVDVDPHSGGRETFAHLTTAGDGLPGTLIASVPRGGTQIIYWLPHSVIVPGGRNKLGPGAGVVSSGGYIVAAGSTIGGQAYTWKHGYEPDAHEFARAPGWLVDLAGRA